MLPIRLHLITRLHASFTVYQLFASNKSGSLIKWVFIMLCLCLRFCLLFLFQFWCVMFVQCSTFSKQWTINSIYSRSRLNLPIKDAHNGFVDASSPVSMENAFKKYLLHMLRAQV